MELQVILRNGTWANNIWNGDFRLTEEIERDLVDARYVTIDVLTKELSRWRISKKVRGKQYRSVSKKISTLCTLQMFMVDKQHTSIAVV